VRRVVTDAIERGERVTIYAPGIGPDYSNRTGSATVEGPHYPEPHTWYAEVTLESGVVKEVK
jgi:hypothetical protein